MKLYVLVSLRPGVMSALSDSCGLTGLESRFGVWRCLNGMNAGLRSPARSHVCGLVKIYGLRPASNDPTARMYDPVRKKNTRLKYSEGNWVVIPASAFSMNDYE